MNLDDLLPPVRQTPRPAWDAITPEHQAWVTAKMTEGVASWRIEIALRSLGYTVTAQTIDRWRTR